MESSIEHSKIPKCIKNTAKFQINLQCDYGHELPPFVYIYYLFLEVYKKNEWNSRAGFEVCGSVELHWVRRSRGHKSKVNKH